MAIYPKFGILGGFKMRPGIFSRLLWASIIAVTGLICIQYYFYHDQKERAELAARQHAMSEVERLNGIMDAKLKKLMMITQSLAAELSAGTIPSSELLTKLRTVMNVNPQVFALGVAFEPYAHRPDLEKYARYYVRDESGNLKLIDVAAIEDYLKDIPYEAWYHQPLKKGPMWMEPYYMPEVGASVVEYCVPFYRLDRLSRRKVPAGIVYIDYSFDDVKQIINSLDLGKNGYGFIVSQKGKYISHPVAAYVKEEKTIFDISRQLNNKVLQQAGARIAARRPGIFQLKNEVNGQLSWLLTNPFSSTGWSLGVCFIKPEGNAAIVTQRRQLIRLVIAAMILLILGVFLVFYSGNNPTLRWWPVVTIVTLILAAGLGLIWAIALHWTPYQSGRQNPITSKADLDKFIRKVTEAAARRREKTLVFIPTGVYVQSVEFVNANNVTLTGYIWQKYRPGVHDGILRGFIFPEQVAGSIGDPVITQDHGVDLMRWNFNATLRQEFDYSRYPFDTKDIWIEIWPESFTGQAILIPDLDGYELIHPATCPGVEPNIVLAGWSLESSFFNYVKNSYSSNFGAANYQKQKNFPDLYFTMIIKRDFMVPFIVNLLPLLVILSILFALLLMGSKEQSKIDSFGLNTSGVIGSCSGLLFSVIVSHSALRNDIPVREILFIEYFYLLVYCMIILVGINSFLFSTISAKRKLWLFDYNDNIIPKLVFWPLILITLIGVTLAIFY